MEIQYQDIILRDFRESDIDDEIRWMNVETRWMKADTPWETFEPVDPDELRAQWLDTIHSIPPDARRWRLEIEKDGRHLGFVCAYYLDENYGPLNYDEWTEDTKTHCALGIELCEPDCRGQGIGPKALTAFMNYYRDNGETEFALETWSGNLRMVKCAEKLGFRVIKRDVGAHEVDGQLYDALVMKLG